MNFCVYKPPRLRCVCRALEQTMHDTVFLRKVHRGGQPGMRPKSLIQIFESSFIFVFTFVILKHFLLSKVNCVQLETFIQAERKRKHCESQISLKTVCCSSFLGNLDIFYALMQQMRSPRMVQNNCSVRVFLIGQLSMKERKRYPVFPWVKWRVKTVTSPSQGPY